MEAKTPASIVDGLAPVNAENLDKPAPAVLNVCDLCGELSGHLIPEADEFGSGGVYVCAACGFIHVKERRSSEEIAKSWDTIFGKGYTSRWPAVEARLRYVATHYDQLRGWRGKHVLEIGAGEGRFLDIVRDLGAAHCAGIEPFAANCERIRAAGHTVFEGTAEQAPVGHSYFDVVVILWTLENSADCIKLLEIAKRFLCQGGSLIVATGSRVLVPFKKPLSQYFSTNPPDTHCFRFSAKSLSRALQKSGFNEIVFNDYQQCDWLVAEARINKHTELTYSGTDDPQDVLGFFDAWSKLFP
jgi:ubiquinone/menaquinone biosynthesis C-methylase UbiE